MATDIDIDQVPLAESEREVKAREFAKKVLSHPRTVNALKRLPGVVIAQDDQTTEVKSRNFGQVHKKTLALNISSLFGVRMKIVDAAVKTALQEDTMGIPVTNQETIENEQEVYKRLKGVAGLPKI